MIPLAQAQSQVARMSGLDRYPSTKEGVGELVKVAALARDLESCKKAVEHFIASPEARCPTPYQLRVEILPPRPELYRVPPKLVCSHNRCDGGGWESVYVLLTREEKGESRYTRKERITLEQYEELAHKVDWVKQEVHEGVRRCSCSGGSAGANRKGPESQGPLLERGAR